MSSSSIRSAEIEQGRHHGRWLGHAQAPATVQKMKQGFFLHDLGYEGNSFCEFTAMKMDHGKLATGRRLERSSTTVGTTFGGALAPRTPSAATV
jgi:hypothetical protein